MYACFVEVAMERKRAVEKGHQPYFLRSCSERTTAILSCRLFLFSSVISFYFFTSRLSTRHTDHRSSHRCSCRMRGLWV